MKYISTIVASILVLALVGCGPSAEQKKMVADLTTEVKTMMDDASGALPNLESIVGEITSAVSQSDTLAKKYPKEAASITDAVNKLNSAKERAMGVKDNVQAWLQAYKVPSLETMSFDAVMAELKKGQQELTSAKSEIDGAMSAAREALDGYKNLAEGLMTKVAAKKK